MSQGTEAAEGHIYFSSAGRSLEGEDEIILTSVGVDIGSATSHLVFSRLVMERMDARYVVAERVVLHQSRILLTPYTEATDIDTEALSAFIEGEYRAAGLARADVDTGALILTGVAVRRRNARAIGDIFAQEAGRFVAVSAGDALEATLAAHGSGAVARSAHSPARVVNIDVGGGTTKITLCAGGAVRGLTAIDIGARVIVLDADGRVCRLEPAGVRFAAACGIPVALGEILAPEAMEAIAELMVATLFEALGAAPLSKAASELHRLPPLAERARPDILIVSGGVSEYVYGAGAARFGDLGPQLGAALRRRIAAWGPHLEAPVEGIRATVIGASQYTVQVSGSTILVHPATTLPLRNAAVIAPDLDLAPDILDEDAIAEAIIAQLRHQDLAASTQPVALFYRWDGSASFQRLDQFCRAVARGFAGLLGRGLPLVLVGEGDVGGLVGIHLVEEARLEAAIVSIDGITARAFDFIDIGAMLAASGAVPVVIKSLVFPTSMALGRQE